MDWTVHEATPDTAPSVREIARESWHAAYDEFLGPDSVRRITDDWYAVDDLTDSITSAAERPDRTFLLATAAEYEVSGAIDGSSGVDESSEIDRSRGTDVAGFAHAGVPDDRDFATLSRLYVRPNRWGAGAGTALLERVEADLRSASDRLRLTVLADNEVGISFYESAGFDRVEVRPSDVGDGLEECVYEKPL